MDTISKSHPETSWKALQYFNYYRFLIALLFVALVWVGQLPEPLGSYHQKLFAVTSHFYLMTALVIAFFIKLHSPRYNLQIAIHVVQDIFFLSILMYSSNGLSSGFGMLILIAVAGGSILRAGKIAILFAAIAALVILGQEVYLQLFRFSPSPNYTHAGFLGITFFATAFLGQVLAVKVEKSEALAQKRAIDLESLSLLNEHIVQRLQSGLVVLDDGQQIRLLNEAAKQLLGLDDSHQNRCLSECAPELFLFMENWRKGDSLRPVTFRPNKGDIDIRASFKRLNPESDFGVLIFLEDVAQLRQQAQNLKVASLGRLSASIAHEVRNPLGAISHASQLLSESSSIEKEDVRLLDIINDHANRVNKIVENMMRISRREPAVPEIIEINSWLIGFVREFTAHKQIKEENINLENLRESVYVKMDPSQLYQVMWNLSENALRYSRGSLLVTYKYGVRKETGRAFIDVIDYGKGITEENVSQLFEPFFTTDTEGSGLGLYISRELCEANQASLALHNNQPNGCCFRVNFTYSDKFYG